jgi:hypothetical protein
VEGGALSSIMKKEHENIDLRAQKMMKGRVEPSIMRTMVKVMLIMVQVIRWITLVPPMTSLRKRQLKEQR